MDVCTGFVPYSPLSALGMDFPCSGSCVCFWFRALLVYPCRYFAIASVFAGIYFASIPRQGVPAALPTYGHALIASLQIQSTIGFAAPGAAHWARSAGVTAAITAQALLTVLFNVFLLGTLFARLSSAKNRAISVRVSSVAVVRECPLPVLEFRVGEIRKHQLLNLRVNAYLFFHNGDKLFQREKLKLNPSDGIFLAVPTELQHVLDETSPLWTLLSLQAKRSFDCEVCGEPLRSRESRLKHLTFFADAKHKSVLASASAVERPSMESVTRLMKASERYWEVVIVVEGTEPITGSPIQARHSYCLSDVWFNSEFVKCWTVTESDGGGKKIVVDFDLFSQVQYLAP